MQGVLKPVAQGPPVRGQTAHARDRTQTYHITGMEQTPGLEGHVKHQQHFFS
jgi:hypothetical protein